MNRQWHPYWQWEDYLAGMYEPPATEHLDRLASDAVAVLASPCEFLGWASRVIKEWPIAAAHNLTAVGGNRRAWVGQAACCLARGVPEIATRAAWKQLSQDQQDTANAVADEVIRAYETAGSRLHRDVGGTGLFGRPAGRSAASVDGAEQGAVIQGDLQSDLAK